MGLVVEATPFYAEAGGQVADTGTLSTADGATFDVSDVKKVGPYVLHIGKVTAGSLSVGGELSLVVDFGRRAPIAKNHTTTHMLNFALKGALKQTYAKLRSDEDAWEQSWETMVERLKVACRDDA